MKNYQFCAIMTGLFVINTSIQNGFHHGLPSDVSFVFALVFGFFAVRNFISDKFDK